MKKFKDTKLFSFIKEKAPQIIVSGLDVIDNFYPPVKLLTTLVEGAVNISPEIKTELKSAIDEYEITELKEYLADVQDARKANITLQTNEHVPMIVKLRPTIIAFIIISIWAFLTVYIICIMFGIIRRDITTNFEAILGLYAGVTAMASSIKDFDFGSSASSKANGDAIREIAKSDV